MELEVWDVELSPGEQKPDLVLFHNIVTFQYPEWKDMTSVKHELAQSKLFVREMASANDKLNPEH